MESPSELSPAIALAEAEQTRRQLAASVSYPPWYEVIGALQAALLMVGITSLAQSPPASVSPEPFVLAIVASLTLATVNVVRFERHNGARISGLRWIGRAGGLYLVVLLLMAIVVSNRVNTTDAWWFGLATAPVAAAVTVVYLRWWLRSYQRGAGA